MIMKTSSTLNIQFIGKANDLKKLIRHSCRGNNPNRKAKISKEELPITIRQTLESDAFKSWVIVDAYKTEDEQYEVGLKNKDIKQIIEFYKNGEIKGRTGHSFIHKIAGK